jgi:hypothetical protein
MSIGAMRAGLAANLATIPGLRVSPYFPDDITPPMAIVDTYRVDFDTAFNRGTDDIVFDVLVAVRRTSERNAQEELDDYLPLVKAALQSDCTLGGSAMDVHVTAAERQSSLSIGETTYLAASYAVRVIATA